MRKRPWLKYEVHRTGTCDAVWNGRPWAGRFEAGCLYSGKTEVYEGVFVKVISEDGCQWLGRDRWCPVDALHAVYAKMNAEGLQLVCAGLDARFYTTGLSDGTGFGYLAGLEDEGAFHILDPIADQEGTRDSVSWSNR